jgi:molybdate transport system substrate-binding protein
MLPIATHAALLAVSVLALPACSRSDAKPVTVFAASSLTEAFVDLEREFEADHPGVDVVVSTAGSQALRLQLEQGAEADVFASANAEHIEALHEAGIAEAPVAFTTNTLVVAVPSDNPAKLTAFADLPAAQKIVLGGDTVPVGKYTNELLDRADAKLGGDFERRVLDRVVSREANVRLLVAKVELGEADAAIVYRSDITAARDVESIPIPDELAPAVEYFVAPLARSRAPELARALTDHLASDRGQATLARHGFGR